ncbi:hypothetical protein HK104_001338 [Borealophlyctis nickersoniae]|nr:hypothetical protein HK104_001338 [Borealophlyctis nickersoniae]
MRRAAAERPDLVEALRELAGLLAEEMDILADKETEERIKTVEIPEDLPDHEKELVRRVQEDKGLQEALKDPKIQRFLMEIRGNPPLLARALATADQDMQKKLKKLIESGLLQVQH